MTERPLREYACWIAAVVVLACLLAGAGVVIWRLEPMRWIDFVLNRDTQPLLFLTLWAILPIFGFPMTIFLVLAGVKFGIVWGILLTLAVMPVHMIASYLVARSFLYRPLLGFLERRGYSLPHLANRRVITGMFVFVSLPGPSYALKNYLLALLDIPFMTYLGMNWSIQSLLHVPIIGLSGAAIQENWGVFSLFALAVAILLVVRWYFKRRRPQPGKDTGS